MPTRTLVDDDADRVWEVAGVRVRVDVAPRTFRTRVFRMLHDKFIQGGATFIEEAPHVRRYDYLDDVLRPGEVDLKCWKTLCNFEEARAILLVVPFSKRRPPYIRPALRRVDERRWPEVANALEIEDAKVAAFDAAEMLVAPLPVFVESPGAFEVDSSEPTLPERQSVLWHAVPFFVGEPVRFVGPVQLKLDAISGFDVAVGTVGTVVRVTRSSQELGRYMIGVRFLPGQPEWRMNGRTLERAAW